MGKPRVWREYGGIEHQANEVPKEAEDMLAPVGEDESLQKIMPAPKCMWDGSTAVVEKLKEVNLSDDSSVQKLISISVYLIVEEKKELVSLLKEFNDVFSWSYEKCQALIQT